MIYTRAFIHRCVKPSIWRWYGCRKTAHLQDAEFRLLFPFRQELHEFLQDFHESARLRFFFHPRNQKDFFLSLLTHTQPYEETLSDAQDVLENKFGAFGSGTINLGETIAWHRDFISGKLWPMKHLSSAEILDIGQPSDIKVVWELNRFHQIWWLGKAYWATQNEEYARKFGELIEDWIQKNPVGSGPNWTIAMEVAIRACNWIAGYYFFCDSPSLSDKFWLKFLKSLHTHGRYVENHLEYARRNGNHLLADVVGLLFLGIFFRSAQFGARWALQGGEAVQEEMDTQVYPDGVDYEKSIGYHRLVLELFYTATVLCQKNRIALEISFLRRLEAMFDFVLAYTRPDGSAPCIGDADDGRLFQFSAHEDFNDHRHALSVGAILFERSDFRTAAAGFSEDALWLFGGEGFENHQRLRPSESPSGSKSFPDGGYYVMRSDVAHVFIDAGEIGMNGRGGHGHNDTFSFELWAHGQLLIVDSGTYCYSSDVQARQEFRGTSAHNTVAMDGREMAEFDALWTVKVDRTHPRLLDWSSTPVRDILEAEHFGYQRLSSPVVHRRRFEFQKKNFLLSIVDQILGAGHHSFKSYLHFAPEMQIEQRDRSLRIHVSSGTYFITTDIGECSLLESSYSPSYGVRRPNKMLCIAFRDQLPQTMTTTVRYERS